MLPTLGYISVSRNCNYYDKMMTYALFIISALLKHITEYSLVSQLSEPVLTKTRQVFLVSHNTTLKEIQFPSSTFTAHQNPLELHSDDFGKGFYVQIETNYQNLGLTLQLWTAATNSHKGRTGAKDSNKIQTLYANAGNSDRFENETNVASESNSKTLVIQEHQHSESSNGGFHRNNNHRSALSINGSLASVDFRTNQSANMDQARQS